MGIHYGKGISKDKMEELSKEMFAPSAEGYDIIMDVCTFGLDNVWKSETILLIMDLLNQQGIKNPKILDVGCGTGEYASLLKVAFNPSYIVGIDITPEMIDIARRTHPDINFEVQSADSTNFSSNTFDLVTSWYLAKYVNPKTVVEEVHRILKSKGIMVFAEIELLSSNLTKKVGVEVVSAFGVLSPVLSEWQPMFEEVPSIIKERLWLNDFDIEMSGLFEDVVLTNLFPGGAVAISGVKG